MTKTDIAVIFVILDALRDEGIDPYTVGTYDGWSDVITAIIESANITYMLPINNSGYTDIIYRIVHSSRAFILEMCDK